MGRVAVTIHALPTIFPIDYAVLKGDVVFHIAAGTTLTAAMCDAVIAFEVDDIDTSSRVGWSVVVVGRSRELTDPAVIAAIAGLPLGTWADTAGTCVVQLRTDVVSGSEILG